MDSSILCFVCLFIIYQKIEQKRVCVLDKFFVFFKFQQLKEEIKFFACRVKDHISLLYQSLFGAIFWNLEENGKGLERSRVSQEGTVELYTDHRLSSFWPIFLMSVMQFG